jgi:hypothetical protein
MPMDIRETSIHAVRNSVDKRFIFNTKEKNHFRKWMRKLEAFCVVQVVTF